MSLTEYGDWFLPDICVWYKELNSQGSLLLKDQVQAYFNMFSTYTFNYMFHQVINIL